MAIRASTYLLVVFLVLLSFSVLLGVSYCVHCALAKAGRRRRTRRPNPDAEADDNNSSYPLRPLRNSHANTHPRDEESDDPWSTHIDTSLDAQPLTRASSDLHADALSGWNVSVKKGESAASEPLVYDGGASVARDRSPYEHASSITASGSSRGKPVSNPAPARTGTMSSSSSHGKYTDGGADEQGSDLSFGRTASVFGSGVHGSSDTRTSSLDGFEEIDLNVPGEMQKRDRGGSEGISMKSGAGAVALREVRDEERVRLDGEESGQGMKGGQSRPKFWRVRGLKPAKKLPRG